MKQYPLSKKHPNTIKDLNVHFSTEEACREYLFRLRWPRGFVCPKCQQRGSWLANRNRLVCSHCRHQTSVIAGTIFQGAHKPLHLLFRAVWHIAIHKQAATVMSLQHKMKWNYTTAWKWFCKIRRIDRLRGIVEVGIMYLEDKTPIAIAVENVKNRTGWIRMQRISEARKSIYQFIKQVIEPGSTVRTVGLDTDLSISGYVHQQVQVRQGKDKYLLPQVKDTVGYFKLWQRYRPQEAIDLDTYIATFTLTKNYRRSPGELFYRVLQRLVQIDPAPYR